MSRVRVKHYRLFAAKLLVSRTAYTIQYMCLTDVNDGRNVSMVLNIGVDCSADGWKTCLMDHGRLLKFNSFTDSPTMLVYLQHICALYPEPTIAVTSDWNTCFAALHTLTERPLHEMKVNGENHLPNDRIQEILIAIGSLNLQSYSIPAVAYLDSIPAYRKLNRAHMGTAAQVS